MRELSFDEMGMVAGGLNGEEPVTTVTVVGRRPDNKAAGQALADHWAMEANLEANRAHGEAQPAPALSARNEEAYQVNELVRKCQNALDEALIANAESWGSNTIMIVFPTNSNIAGAIADAGNLLATLSAADIDCDKAKAEIANFNEKYGQ